MTKRLCILFLSISFLQCTPKQNSRTDTIYGVVDANIKMLDPIHTTDTYSSKMVSQVYEGLYHYHYLKRPLSLEPLLADGMPEISKDGRIYKIKIKKGILFQDHSAFTNGKGRELVANDFIYSWKRLADASNKALGWWVLDGKIKGLNEWRKKLSQGRVDYTSKIEGLRSEGPHLLIIELTKPTPLFTMMLATPATQVVPMEVVKQSGKEFPNKPLGTGPYRLDKWVRNSELRFSRNPNYRDTFYPNEGTDEDKKLGRLKDAGKKLPLTENLVIRIMPKRQPMWLSFVKGELDHAIVPKDNFSQVFNNDKTIRKDITAKGIKIHAQTRPDYTYLALNMEHPILGKNKYLRQALAMSYDNKTAIDKFYNGRGLEAQSPIPPGFQGYDPNYKKPFQYDVEKAKAYMAKAGYPNGKGLPVFNYEMANSGSWTRQMAEYIKQQFQEIGVKIKLIPNTWPQFDKKIKTKRADLFSMAWIADYPDAENFLQAYYSKNISPGSNNFNFMNRQFDEMYEKSLLLQPGPERTELYKKMVRFLNQETPAIIHIHRFFRLPYHGWLRNYKEYPVIHDFYKYLGIDSKKKKELKKNL